MARIVPIKTVVTFNQQADKQGNYFPCCVYSNERFLQNFEKSLIVANSIIEPQTELYLIIESVLRGLSDYRVWRENQTKSQPIEILEHCAILPREDCIVSIEFQSTNDTPTEAMLFSFQEITDITTGLQTASEMLKKEADFERLEVIKPILNGFKVFLDEWAQHESETGSYFSTIETVS